MFKIPFEIRYTGKRWREITRGLCERFKVYRDMERLLRETQSAASMMLKMIHELERENEQLLEYRKGYIELKGARECSRETLSKREL